jgi:anti-sigma factor RsiW
MRCLDVQAALEAYVDKSLNPGQATSLEKHLASCRSCQEELAYLQAVEEALGTWPLIAEPDDLTARVMAQVKRHPELPRVRIRWSDLAVGLAGAILATAAPLLWRLLAPINLAQSLQQLHDTVRLQMLPLEMLQLDISLRLQPLIETGLWIWLPVFAGAILALILLPVVWFPIPRGQRTPA